jgi:hypothetical protein
MPSDITSAVTTWFRSHHGVISRAEALRLGLTTGQIGVRVRTGEWEQTARGVYRLAGSPSGPLADLRAAVLVSGAAAAASHGSAAWLWGLTDAPAVPTVTLPHSRKATVPGVRAVRSRIPVRAVVRRGIPCTDRIRTILDCASEGAEVDVDDLVDRALARRLASLGDLARAIEATPALRMHPGRAELARRLARRGVTGGPAPSVLESRMGRLLASHGLPTPKAEVVWGPQRRYRLDFAYPHLRLAIEVDGLASHFTPEQQRWDNRRSNALSAAGWTVLHYSWWDVTYEPGRVADEIASAYRTLAA